MLGNGILNSPDPNEAIQLHPLALAAFGGLIINALSLLPLGNTDGGRISVAFFGRSFSRVVQGTTLLGLVLRKVQVCIVLSCENSSVQYMSW